MSGNTHVFAFACRVAWVPEWGETIYNRATAGQAKRAHHLRVSEPWPNTKYTEIRVRKVGRPHSSDRFIANAVYRGLPDVRCGDRVSIGNSTGTIVGHDSSANFEVLFDTGGKYSGLMLSVHPSELQLLKETASAD